MRASHPSAALARAIAIAVLIASACDAAEGPPPQTIAQLKATASARDFAPARVRTSGIVTWVDDTAGKRFCIYDGSGGIWIEFDGDTWPELTTTVDVEGTLTRGLFGPVVTASTFQTTGTGKLPPVIILNQRLRGDFLHGYFNDQPVSVDGWVRSAEMITPTTLVMALNAGSYRIKARVSNVTDIDPEAIVASKVRVRGIATPVRAQGAVPRLIEAQIFGANFPPQIPHYLPRLFEVQILVAGQEHLHVLEMRGVSPWEQDLTPVANVFDYVPGRFVRGDWKRVRGQIVHIEDGTAYLSDGTSGLAIKGFGIPRLTRGDWVEAAGYPDLDGALPMLSDAMVRPAAPDATSIPPTSFEAADLLDDKRHASYVTVKGRVLDRMQAPHPGEENPRNTVVLALQSPNEVFMAEVEVGSDPNPLPSVEIGCVVEVSGVCVVQTDASGDPASFKILVPTPDDIAVVSPASFFTVKRLLVALSILLGILLVVSWFAYFFAKRTIRLRAEMHERQAISSERNRLARDLHDTLQQGLVAIQYRLDGIDHANGVPPETHESLDAVRNLVTRCHSETRQSIWNLRAYESEHIDLGDALKRSAQLLARGLPIDLEFHHDRQPSAEKIPDMIEDNVLRIGREAIANAISHARPTRIRVDLRVTAEQLDLAVFDDGIGMQGEHSPPGHFGLQGMRERARRIGGTLEIDSAPGKGCTVRISVPLKHDIELPAS